MLRHKVKSGVTGWAQVNGLRGNTSLEKRIQYDIEYIERWSLWLDLKIIALTVVRVALRPERLLSVDRSARPPRAPSSSASGCRSRCRESALAALTLLWLWRLRDPGAPAAAALAARGAGARLQRR